MTRRYLVRVCSAGTWRSVLVTGARGPAHARELADVQPGDDCKVSTAPSGDYVGAFEVSAPPDLEVA